MNEFWKKIKFILIIIGEHEFTFLFYAYKEKLDEEQVLFSIKDGNKEVCLCINFEAKVLGINQGTPSLRNGK